MKKYGIVSIAVGLVVSTLIMTIYVKQNYLLIFPMTVSIDDNALTAKELKAFSDEYIKKYVKGKDMFLSGIDMCVNERHEGKVTMIYTHHKNGRNYKYSVEINTIEHIINKFQRSTIGSSRLMNINEWRIDSDEAVTIALHALRNNGYEVDGSNILIYGGGDGEAGGSWYLLFQDDDYFERFEINPYVYIDAYTGEVSSHDLSFDSE